MLLFIALAVPSSPKIQNLVLTNTSHDLVTLNPTDELIVDIGKSPLLLFLPRLAGLSVDLYKQVQTANIFIASLSEGSTMSGVYFPAGGRIMVSSTPQSTTVFEYFTIRPTRPCPIFQLTTLTTDFFNAHLSDKTANLTIKNNQKYCVFHISDAPESTTVFVNYSTEDFYDILYFTNGETEYSLTGDGSFRGDGRLFSLFTWISDATTLSHSFSFQIASPGSRLPPVRLNYTAQSWPDTDTDPVILERPLSGAAAPWPTSRPYAKADAQVFARPIAESGPDRAIVVGVSVVVLCLIGAGVLWGGRGWLRTLQRPGDDPGALMLAPGAIERMEGADSDRLEVTSADA
jgi:hypothetical protein